MTRSSDSGMLVFRDGRRLCSTSGLIQELQGSFRLLASEGNASRDTLLQALLQAGELECGLADAGSQAVSTLADTTDLLASALLGHAPISVDLLQEKLRLLSSSALPAQINLSVPEGFAYYALHPLDYAEALKAANELPRAGAVVGIRSIGTTLSAIVKAHLHSQGIWCERITVRPTGHPFDRQMKFQLQQKHWIADWNRRGATFYIVDEGPGMSGSSFLATAEAVLGEGVQSSKIVLMCSSQPDLKALLACNAAERWQRFRTLAARMTSQLPSEATIFFGSGQWRATCFDNEADWPASWLQMERLKFLSEDKRQIFRFDGLGSYGSPVRERYSRVADGGYGPHCANAGDGFTQFSIIKGSVPRRVAQPLVERAAEYCAYRSQMAPTDTFSQSTLEEMARINIERELGCGLGQDFCLEVVRPVVVDGKMMLYEWLQPKDGGPALKIDSAAHGDDHFFPGPTDIAWDLAGTIIEWRMDDSTANQFLTLYERGTKDPAHRRLRAYQIAYVAFRMGYSKMAAAAMGGGHEEESRLMREYRFYKERLARMLALEAAV